MPITEKGYEYQMPDGIRDQLTREFLTLFHSKVTRYYKQRHNMKDEEFTNIGFYAYTDGNGIWFDSFIDTCAETNKAWLGEYFKHLPWYESDIFCGSVSDHMVELGVIEQGVDISFNEEEL